MSHGNLFNFRGGELVVHGLELVFFYFVEKERHTHPLVCRLADWVQHDHEWVGAHLANEFLVDLKVMRCGLI